MCCAHARASSETLSTPPKASLLVQRLITSLAAVPAGKLKEWSVLHEWFKAQINGLTVKDTRANRYTNKFLFFCAQVLKKAGAAGYNYLRGVPLQPSLPPGTTRRVASQGGVESRRSHPSSTTTAAAGL